jgi:hypothetical protein
MSEKTKKIILVAWAAIATPFILLMIAWGLANG